MRVPRPLAVVYDMPGGNESEGEGFREDAVSIVANLFIPLYECMSVCGGPTMG